MGDYPSLRTAILIFQLLVGAGVAAWIYTAWVLYQREPGTLGRAQTSLIVGAFLRVVGSWSIILFGGLPSAAIQELIPEVFLVSLFILVFTGIWYSYLARSEKVREIFADQ